MTQEKLEKKILDALAGSERHLAIPTEPIKLEENNKERGFVLATNFNKFYENLKEDLGENAPTKETVYTAAMNLYKKGHIYLQKIIDIPFLAPRNQDNKYSL